MTRTRSHHGRRHWGSVLITMAFCSIVTVARGAAADERLFRSGPEAFAYLHEVATHPRCVNCHGRAERGRIVPTVGDAMVPHPMNVTARHVPATFQHVPVTSRHVPAPAQVGDSSPAAQGVCAGVTTEEMRFKSVGAIRCTSCHGPGNSPDHGGPPGAWDTHLKWQMPIRSLPRLSPDVSAEALCRTWYRAFEERNATRSACGEPRRAFAREFADHIAMDRLIAWAFDPGPGRTPAPGSVYRLASAARDWAEWLEPASLGRPLRDDELNRRCAEIGGAPRARPAADAIGEPSGLGRP